MAMLGWGGVPGAICGASLWGLGMGANWTLGTTSMQLAADRESLGRVVATDAFAFALAWATGAVVAAAAAMALPLPAIAVSLGAGAIVSWALFERSRRSPA